MAKQPWKVELTIESDEAVGLVLRKLHEMPGVTDILPILGGVGGTGPGAKRLEEAANASRAKVASSSQKIGEAILKLLMSRGGPVSLDEITAGTGRKRASVAQTLYKLKKDGIVRSDRTGFYEMAMPLPTEGQIVPPPIALPAPAHAPSGRMAQGVGLSLMLVILLRNAAALPSAILRQQLQLQGIPPTSISGTIERAKRDKLLKSNGSGNKVIYELTAKGQQAAQQQAEAVSAHG